MAFQIEGEYAKKSVMTPERRSFTLTLKDNHTLASHDYFLIRITIFDIGDRESKKRRNMAKKTKKRGGFFHLSQKRRENRGNF